MIKHSTRRRTVFPLGTLLLSHSITPSFDHTTVGRLTLTEDTVLWLLTCGTFQAYAPRAGSAAPCWVDGELTGILSIQTGAPLTVLAGADSMRTGLSSQRAVILEAVDPYQNGPGKCPGFSFCEPFLSPAAFALSASNTLSAQGKNVFRGPNQWTWDMSFFKNFRHEKFNVQLRWEFFNIFNNVALNLPSFVFRKSRFGAFTQAEEPRIGQVGLKVSF